MRKKTNKAKDDDDLLSEYDFSKMKLVGKGVYAEQYRSGTNLVLLDSDVRKAFPNDEDVNEALRVIAKAAKQQAARARNRDGQSRKRTSKSRRAASTR
ncbi:MAG TPA: hypothetical protein VJT74_14520 [Pyrinomonadaceae bacterium]|nr:hypothetical protein [Pyrinomonadaceae bacterium]